MRRLMIVIIACMALLVGLAAQAQAEPQRTEVTTTQQVPTATEASATGWAMGGYPNYWTICAANGVGGTYWPNLITKWTWAGHELDLRVQNRCDGYSITNRFTFEYYTDSTNTCAKITNAHKTWSPARQKYIWDQNPILWININDICAGVGGTNPTRYDHNVQEWVGWLLGLYPDLQDCNCVMGNTANDRDTIRYVVLHDILDMDVVYAH